MNFRIPEFPLGALFAAIMATVAILFAFPDLAGDWLWWALTFAAFIAWAAGAGLLNQTNSTVDSEPEATERGDDAQKENGDRIISPDAAALVNAINRQERANRAQEQREDDKKRTREIITMFIIAVTGGAIIVQVSEMKKAYVPISEQARAAKDNRIADHRAWIGVTHAFIDPLITPGIPIKASIFYANTGRDPARLSTSTHTIALFPDDWDNGKAFQQIMKWHDTCFAIQSGLEDRRNKGEIAETIVVFPTLGQNEYAWYFSTHDSGSNKLVVDRDMMSGNKIVIVLGCFVYMSFDVMRHTTYCGTDATGTQISATLNACPIGNDAD